MNFVKWEHFSGSPGRVYGTIAKPSSNQVDGSYCQVQTTHGSIRRRILLLHEQRPSNTEISEGTRVTRAGVWKTLNHFADHGTLEPFKKGSEGQQR